MRVYYAYLQTHRTSFTLVAEAVTARLRRMARVAVVPAERLRELSIPGGSVVAVHPYLVTEWLFRGTVERLRSLGATVVAVDVSNAGAVTALAAEMFNWADAVIVPSEWSRRALIESGVRVPVYVVPHGVDERFYFSPRHNPTSFPDLEHLKRDHGLKLVLFFLWHSPLRKGWDLVLEWYARLKKERGDVLLVVKASEFSRQAAEECRKLGCAIITGWLSEGMKIQLYDLADLYPLFSRCGGFELNGLEAAARLVPVIASDTGPWAEYLPGYLLVRASRDIVCEEGNPLYEGPAREVDVERAVDKALEILDDLDEYRARLAEWREKVIARRFTWEEAARRTLEVLLSVGGGRA